MDLRTLTSGIRAAIKRLKRYKFAMDRTRVFLLLRGPHVHGVDVGCMEAPVGQWQLVMSDGEDDASGLKEVSLPSPSAICLYCKKEDHLIEFGGWPCGWV